MPPTLPSDISARIEPGGGEGLGIDAGVVAPEAGADEGAGALEVDLDDLDDHDGARGLAVDGEGLEQGRVGVEMGAAV